MLQAEKIALLMEADEEFGHCSDRIVEEIAKQVYLVMGQACSQKCIQC